MDTITPWKSARLLGLASCLAATLLHAEGVEQVDPTIGTTGGGNTTIGPPCPSDDQARTGYGRNDQNSGYFPGDNINGFSQTHVSGTGADANMAISCFSPP